ncbi:hypothetical protein [Mucilaginibacter glaciei]|uniref:Lipid-binding hydrolase n=1 Tax=Mucilaginibacter glaciei TaxID=2772109 RepID=A0A926NYQ4_9SPHI|nr:hypothetical protein [Mucilaginibacter glaciei]MBD1394114.1 hypothetical protein [Mucilaginibacter glaciei]
MKQKLLFPFVMVALFFTACKKDAVNYTEFAGTAITATVTTVAVNSAYNYQPVKQGSYWKYAFSGATVDTTIATMLNTTAVFSARSYFVGVSKASSEPKAGSVYFYNTGETYSERDIDADNDTTEVIYLKADVAVGTTWNAAEYFVSKKDIGSKVTGKMVEKGITRTVFNKKFNNVIHTSILVQAANGSGGFTDVGNYDYYIAKGVGIIEESATVFGIKVTGKLYDFSIK